MKRNVWRRIQTHYSSEFVPVSCKCPLRYFKTLSIVLARVWMNELLLKRQNRCIISKLSYLGSHQLKVKWKSSGTWSGRSCSLWINHIRSWISPLEESQSTISESRGRGEGSFLRGVGNNFLALKREAYLSNVLYIHAVRLPKWEISRQKCKI